MKKISPLLAHLGGELHIHSEDISVIILGFLISAVLIGAAYALRHDSNR